MMSDTALALLALAGHWGAAIFFITRLHASALGHQINKAIDWIWLIVTPGLPLAIAWLWWQDHVALSPFTRTASRAGMCPVDYLGTAEIAAHFYLLLCYVLGVLFVLWWLEERWRMASPERLSASTRAILDTTDLVEGLERDGRSQPDEPLVRAGYAEWLTALPGNESLTLEVNTKQVSLPRLPPELDRLSVLHLSDLHLTGKLRPAFYRAVVQAANALGGDLIVITGDIIDRDECLPWLGELLGELQAPHGVYFVLGNHDLRVRNPLEVRQRLTAAGLIDLGARSHMAKVRGREVLLAGNESPWFSPPENVPAAGDLRISLLHTPDLLPWARQNQFDLALAGHLHGGQVTLPLIGPIIAPSWHGTYYAEGLYREPPTVLHVSRGVAALHPYRFGARPEITRLDLRRSFASGSVDQSPDRPSSGEAD